MPLSSSWYQSSGRTYDLSQTLACRNYSNFEMLANDLLLRAVQILKLWIMLFYMKTLHGHSTYVMQYRWKLLENSQFANCF